MKKLRVGIFFGGQSREREISFAGGRTVYDNLNKSLFEAVPVFVDSLGNFILLDWQFVYKGTIRDFYPPVSVIPESPNGFQVYAESLGTLSEEDLSKMLNSVGKPLQPQDFAKHFDLAFLSLHGPYGEDGNIQGILEWYGIPYTGSGVLPSALGIDKAVQRQNFEQLKLNSPKSSTLSLDEWNPENAHTIFNKIESNLGLPFVVKAPHQGSSIGVAIVTEESEFKSAVEKAFFRITLTQEEWKSLGEKGRLSFIQELIDIRSGIGLPVTYSTEGENMEIIFHPEALLTQLNTDLLEKNIATVSLQSLDHEHQILIEGFIKGREFSCIVVQQPNGSPLALPPTEIVKNDDLFDYRSKYLPGMSRKQTPIQIPTEQIQKIQDDCCALYTKFHFNVYARIDGFITAAGEVFLNDPNTTSGMMPSSFFFHQAAEIGLNPSQFLTYILYTSLQERLKTGKRTYQIKQQLLQLDQQLLALQQANNERVPVAVIMGGYSSERHISVESGRNIFEKLASSTKYEVKPVFLTGNASAFELYELPVNLLLKDNADDIRYKVKESLNGERHPVIEQIINDAAAITQKFASDAVFTPRKLDFEQLAKEVKVVFIALHGRPGEDGALQAELQKVGLPYNGSGVESSQTTIDKYRTNEILAQNGIKVAKHALVQKAEWLKDAEAFYQKIEKEFGYPLIAKPSDDGCSSAVKKVDTRAELEAFVSLMFRAEEPLLETPSKVLSLSRNEEFPQKDVILIEELISKNDATHFLEITGGLLTHINEKGERHYEVFEPSEALATNAILSLEEKFLAGEGQNITPARYARQAKEQARISAIVRKDLEKVAKILNVEGYCRTDAFVKIYEDGRVDTYVIEINSLPGMTPATCIFHQAAINNYKPYEFIDGILEYGRKKEQVL